MAKKDTYDAGQESLSWEGLRGRAKAPRYVYRKANPERD